MASVRRAVIDVGTNSIKLLVGEVDGKVVHPLWEESRQTRLGKGFYPGRMLQRGPIEESAKAIGEFANKAAEMGASQPKVVATSATREAQNQEELIAAVARSCGLAVHVISGEQEAEYSFQGVTSDPRLANEPLLLLDVGGGSTEFILGRDKRKHFAQSFQMGSVRLLERAHPSDPPSQKQLTECREWVRHFLQTEINPNLARPFERETASGAPIQLVGTGGTASILACMEAKLTTFDRERLEATRLTRGRLRWHVEHLWALPLADRLTIAGLPPNRADVILTGSVIYEAIMDHFHFEQLRISTRGLRFAVLMQDD